MDRKGLLTLLLVTSASLLGARTLLGAPGLTSNKKLLGAYKAKSSLCLLFHLESSFAPLTEDGCVRSPGYPDQYGGREKCRQKTYY